MIASRPPSPSAVPVRRPRPPFPSFPPALLAGKLSSGEHQDLAHGAMLDGILGGSHLVEGEAVQG